MTPDENETIRELIDRLHGLTSSALAADSSPEYEDALFSRLAREAVLTRVHFHDPDLCPCEGCQFNRHEIERIRAKYQADHD